MYNCIENYRHTQEKQPYNDNVEEIYPEFSTYFFCEQVTNILETSPPVVYALQRKVGQYLKAFQGTYIPGNPEKWWVFWHGHGFKRKTHLCKLYIFEVQAFGFNEDQNWSQMLFRQKS